MVATIDSEIDPEAAVRSLQAQAAAALAQPDPLKKAVTCNALMAEIDVLKKEVAEGRAVAIWEANEGVAGEKVSLARLAEALGVSKTLIQQLVASGKRTAAERKRKRK